MMGCLLSVSATEMKWICVVFRVWDQGKDYFKELNFNWSLIPTCIVEFGDTLLLELCVVK